MILTPRSLGVIAASTATSFLLKRWGYRQPMVLGLLIMSVATILLGRGGFDLLRMLGVHLGVAETLAVLVMIAGIGIGTAIPASYNACIELMPERVATITGLRGMFRSIGGAVGISLITIILHLSATRELGFRIVFISFGLGLFFTIPLVFRMPTGRQGWR
jgi:MFS family permease